MALATTDDLKTLLTIRHSEDDALFARLLSAASAQFERQAGGRSILAADYTRELDGTGGTTIVVPDRPLLAVTSLYLAGDVDPVPESGGYGEDGYFIRGNCVYLRGYRTTEGQGTVSISYRAGFEEIPEDIRQAVLEMAALMFRERERYGQQSRNGPDGSTVFYYAPPARWVAAVEAYGPTGVI